MLKRASVLAYGVMVYTMFLGVFLGMVAFLGNFFVPRSIDSAAVGPLGMALLINSLLVLVFGLQHSVMARPAFKRWWTRIVPEPMERSTYMLFTNLALILLMWQWRPMGGVIWDVQHPIARGILYALFACGWMIVLATTFLINHFDLFGLRQSWLYFRGKECRPLGFVTPGPYRWVRHPLYVGWITVFWAAPTMTISHLLFAIGLTTYILIAIVFEERDLMASHIGDYARYRREVPMLIPRFGRRSPLSTASPIPTQPMTGPTTTTP